MACVLTVDARTQLDGRKCRLWHASKALCLLMTGAVLKSCYCHGCLSYIWLCYIVITLTIRMHKSCEISARPNATLALHEKEVGLS